jgi:hypothetical protein
MSERRGWPVGTLVPGKLPIMCSERIKGIGDRFAADFRAESLYQRTVLRFSSQLGFVPAALVRNLPESSPDGTNEGSTRIVIYVNHGLS